MAPHILKLSTRFRRVSFTPWELHLQVRKPYYSLNGRLAEPQRLSRLGNEQKNPFPATARNETPVM